MRTKISLIIKSIALIILIQLCCFNVESSIAYKYGLFLSNMHIAFALIFSVVTSYKYYILKRQIESNKKHKHFKAILLIISFFCIINAIYNFMPKYYNIKDWTISNNQNTNDLINFIFLPKYNNTTLNISLMTLLEAIFSLLIVVISFIRAKIQTGYKAYIIDRILKRIFRYQTFLIFLIYILTIPNKFLTVRKVKYISIGIFIIAILISIIKDYLIMRMCKNKNKEKYGKENLIIVITEQNYTFNLDDYLISPLHAFYRYDNKNLVKSLLVSGKKYSFVLYDAIRYNLINVNQYNNIAYLFIISKSVRSRNKQLLEFNEKIKTIANTTQKFMIYKEKDIIFKLSILEALKDKYTFKVKEKLNIKDVLDMTALKPSADELKIKIKKLLKYIEDKEQENQEKNIYLKYGMNLILESFNYIEYFYTLLKMSEYIIHYMGLKSILIKDNISAKKVENIKQATWRAFIDFSKEYSVEENGKIEDIITVEEVSKSIIKIKNIIRKLENKKEQNKTNEKDSIDRLLKTYTFKDICETIANIRNKILVHGSISEPTAEEIVNDLCNMLVVLVTEFEELNITIEDNEKIKNIFEKDMLAVYRYSNKMFLYSNPVLEDKKIIYNECLNYETGKKKVIDAEAHINIDNIFSIEQIREKLGNWM